MAVAYAARHPERVSRLILFGSYIKGAFSGPPDSRQFAEAQALERLIEVGWGHDFPAFRQVFSSLLMPGATLEQMHALADLERASCSSRTAARFWHAFHAYDVSDVVDKVQAQPLVLHVRGDAMVPFEEGANWRPGCRTRGWSHWKDATISCWNTNPPGANSWTSCMPSFRMKSLRRYGMDRTMVLINSRYVNNKCWSW